MRILIVDDEDMQRDMLKGFLEKQGYDVTCAPDGEKALKRFQDFPFQLVILDHRMPGMSGDELFEQMKKINPFVRSIMITAYGTINTAVKMMKLGADEFLEKPVDLMMLLDRIRKIEQFVEVSEDVECVYEKLEKGDIPINIIGNSLIMRKVISLVQRVAISPWTVLIRGETGTGKELIARLVHLLSDRKDGPFIDVNCGAVPENLFESELFGHEKGAFTGAVAARRGRFELAQDGTLFLDEIGELPMNLQSKLLRSLQEKKISRVGSEKEIDINVRVVAATNRNLKDMVDNGRFREDLYYRLNVFDIELPSLREKKEDIPELIKFFIEKYSPHSVSLDQDALTTLIKYSFPGNVRELEHIVQRTVTLSRSNVIRITDLPPEIRYHKVMESGTLTERLNMVEKDMLLSALEKHNWVQTKAALSLGISERVLRYKMAKYDIKRE